MTTFAELGLSKAVLKAVEAMGYEESSPMQAQAVLLLMKGRDVIIQSLTGTGKTVAFGIPIVEQVEPRHLCGTALWRAVYGAPASRFAAGRTGCCSNAGPSARPHSAPLSESGGCQARRPE